MTKLVCMADTHNRHAKLAVPDGDIVIHAGDATMTGSYAEMREFVSWFRTLPHRWKIFVPGNHDIWAQQYPEELTKLMLGNGIRPLVDVGTQLRPGPAQSLVNLYGSPWTPEFNDWGFVLPRCSQALSEKWQMMPSPIDVLVTHGPPFGIADTVYPNGRDRMGTCVGDEMLARELSSNPDSLKGIRPRVHVFGHIHEHGGTITRIGDKVRFVNCAVLDEHCEVAHDPMVVEL